jgi:hypothetical protein
MLLAQYWAPGKDGAPGLGPPAHVAYIEALPKADEAQRKRRVRLAAKALHP